MWALAVPRPQLLVLLPLVLVVLVLVLSLVAVVEVAGEVVSPTATTTVGRDPATSVTWTRSEARGGDTALAAAVR
jgi:hypothetical protein